MLKNFFKGLLVRFRLLFIINKSHYKQEPKQSNADVDLVGNSVLPNTIPIEKEHDQLKFDRVNNLVAEFNGDVPIVYEADGVTIRKQSQYGYEGPDKTDYRDDFDRSFDDEFSGERQRLMDKIYGENKTVNFETKNTQFEERWNKIKEQVRDEDSEIDGIIKE